jgi:hypothetical protein
LRFEGAAGFHGQFVIPRFRANILDLRNSAVFSEVLYIEYSSVYELGMFVNTIFAAIIWSEFSARITANAFLPEAITINNLELFGIVKFQPL